MKMSDLASEAREVGHTGEGPSLGSILESALQKARGTNVALTVPEAEGNNVPDAYGVPHFTDKQLHVKSTPADTIRENGTVVANALWDMRDYHLKKAANFDAAANSAISRAESDAAKCEEGEMDMDTILRILSKNS